MTTEQNTTNAWTESVNRRIAESSRKLREERAAKIVEIDELSVEYGITKRDRRYLQTDVEIDQYLNWLHDEIS